MKTPMNMQIGDCDDAGGGEEIAHRLEFADLVGKRTGGAAAPRHGERQRMLEEHGGNMEIDPPPGDVEHDGAQLPQSRIENERDDHADGQRP